jgi:hypothetical protein
MSRKLLAFLLSELKIVRVICKSAKCNGNGVTEIPIGRIRNTFDSPVCPICREPLAADHLIALAKAIEAIHDNQKKPSNPGGFDVEFIITDESK